MHKMLIRLNSRKITEMSRHGMLEPSRKGPYNLSRDSIAEFGQSTHSCLLPSRERVIRELITVVCVHSTMATTRSTIATRKITTVATTDHRYLNIKTTLDSGDAMSWIE